jgi:alcohol dehydrogenase class IV
MANWQKYIFENDDKAAAQIMLAANYGGRAINITQTTAPHAMSYKITSLYKLPHGHAVAVCLPEVWTYMMEHPEECIDKRGDEYLMGVFDKISHSMGASTPMEAIALFREMMKEMELGNPVSENREADLEVLASSVNPVRLKNNPVKLSNMVCFDLYKKLVIEN